MWEKALLAWRYMRLLDCKGKASGMAISFRSLYIMQFQYHLAGGGGRFVTRYFVDNNRFALQPSNTLVKSR